MPTSLTLGKKKLITQQNILSNAAILFSDLGYKNTSIECIAQHAHISRSSLYNFFKCKEEIVSEILQMVQEKLDDLDLYSQNLKLQPCVYQFFKQFERMPIRIDFISQLKDHEMAKQINERIFLILGIEKEHPEVDKTLHVPLETSQEIIESCFWPIYNSCCKNHLNAGQFERIISNLLFKQSGIKS